MFLLFCFSLGLSKLKQHCCSLDQFLSQPINTLCICNDKQYHFVLFQYAGDLIGIIEPFYEVTETFRSSIFILIWNQTIANSPAITISQVKSLIWDRAYGASIMLLQKLSTLSITFTEFYNCFGPNGEHKSIAKELKTFSCGLKSNILTDESIDHICACVETCRKLQKGYQAADLILKIRTLLSLKGGFNHLEHIAKVMDWYIEVSLYISILASITCTTMDTGICT